MFIRRRARRAALAAGLVAALAATAEAEPRFPETTTSDLNGRELTFPQELPAERTLLFVAFKREQQAVVDEWIAELDLEAPDAPAWLELPVIEDLGALWRGFIDNGMRSGVTSTETRARVFTIYGDTDAFREALGLGSEDLVYLLVVDREGRVLARDYGGYRPEKAPPLLEALGE